MASLATGGKSAQITLLVQQLKAGEITKEELFVKLQRLQQGSSVSTAPEAAAAPAPPAPSTNNTYVPAPVSAQYGGEAAGARLDVDAGRRGAPAAAPPAAPSAAGGLTMDQFMQQQHSIMAAAAALQEQARQAGLRVPLVVPPSLPTPGAPAPGGGSAPVNARATSVSSARRGRLAPSSATRASPPYSGSAAAQVEAARRSTARKSIIGMGSMEECTFKPHVNPLPPSYNTGGVPFEERVVAWSVARREEAARKADEAAARALAECTFQPAINATSKEAAGRRSVGSGAADIHERLYAQARTPAGGASGGLDRHDYSSAARLFAQGGGGEREGAGVSGAESAPPPKALTPEEEALLRECTFKPKLNASDGALPVRSRYREVTPSRPRRPLPLPSGMDGATFRPATNPVKPALMPAAAVYVQAPIYERLSKTHTKSQVERERAVAEDAARMAAEKLGAAAEAAGESVPGRGRQPPGGEEEGGSPMTVGEREERRQAQADFLTRQTDAVVRKKEKADALRAAMTGEFQPALCNNSLRLVESKRLGPFIERLTQGGITKEQDMMKSRVRLARDPDCTFHPAINPSSRVLQPRSVADLSRGDALKKETAIRALRLRAEQEDLEGITFQPVINRSRRASEGKLRILSDPDSYIARVQREAAAASEKARRVAAEQEHDELVECTFKPATHDAPQYVKRIARSMALARAVKAPEAPAFRSDWR